MPNSPATIARIKNIAAQPIMATCLRQTNPTSQEGRSYLEGRMVQVRPAHRVRQVSQPGQEALVSLGLEQQPYLARAVPTK